MVRFLKSVLFVVASLMLALVSFVLPVSAAENRIQFGMLSSGSPVWDTLDPSGTNDLVRTHDSISYDLIVQHETGSAIPELVTVTMGSFSLPGTYTGPALSKIAVFDVSDIPVGPAGCQNLSLSPVTDPPPTNVSGVTADGQKVFCWLQANTSSQMMTFKSRILAEAPNGAQLTSPTASIMFNGQTFVEAGVLSNDGIHYGLPTLTVVAEPRWNVQKIVNWKDARMIPKSGPNLEDGYVFTYNVGVFAEGSRKGIELLQSPIRIEDQYGDPDFPGMRLMTWDVQNPFMDLRTTSSTLVPALTNYCWGMSRSAVLLGNSLDHFFFQPRDIQAAINPSAGDAWYSVANGGVCDIPTTSIDTANSSFTMEISGADLRLYHYPKQRGSNTASDVLVNPTNPDDPTNEWWVSDKWFVAWAPLGDIDLTNPPTTEQATNTMNLIGTSITGQQNIETNLAENSATYAISRILRGTYEKMHTTWRWSNPDNFLLALRDANSTADSVVNQLPPDQYFASYQRITNTGTEKITNGIICDKIDNSRTQFVDTSASIYAVNGGTKDANTGTGFLFLGGSTAYMPGFKVQIGVANPSDPDSWTTVNNVTNEYVDPALSGSDQADAGCGDADATWFDTVSAVTNAGYSLSEVNRVRITFDSMDPSVSFLFFIPLKTVGSFTYPVTDIVAGATNSHAAGATTIDQYSPNQGYLYGNGGLIEYKDSDAVKIIGREWVKITKTSPSYPKDTQVGVLNEITYNLQVNLTSTHPGHLTDVTVWDVIPANTSYVPGSTIFGGVPAADPVCTDTGLPPEFFPTGLPAGYLACQWVLPQQFVTRADYGAAAGNIPLLSFRVLVSALAPDASILFNTAFATSTNNDLVKAYYADATRGFVCQPNENCSYSNYPLKVSATQAFVVQKFAPTPIVGASTPLSYSLVYGAIDNNTANVRLLDILPYASDGRGSSCTGTAKLSSYLSAPAADPVNGFMVDNSIVYYYTKKAPATISRNPYDPSIKLSPTGNLSTDTVFCTQAQILSGLYPQCPAGLNEVTAFMASVAGGGPMNSKSRYQIKVELNPLGNLSGNTYSNNFFMANSVANPTPSSTALVRVVAPDLVMAKTSTANKVSSGQSFSYLLVVKNNAAANTGAINAPATISIADTLPAGIAFTQAADISGENWDCSASLPPSTVRCSYTGAYPILPGASVGAAIVVRVYVVPGTLQTTPTAPLINNACVTLTGNVDAVAANNCAKAPVSVLATYSVDIIKSMVGTGPYVIGDTINFSVTVTNTGNNPLNNVTLVDNMGAFDACAFQPAGGTDTPLSLPVLVPQMQPLDKIICTFTHQVNQTDWDNGKFINTATVDSDETPPRSNSAGANFVTSPQLSITKAVSSPAPVPSYQVGDIITYTITVTNTGDVNLNEVTVKDNQALMGLCQPAIPTPLGIGESITCTATTIVTEQDILNHLIVNTATADSEKTDPVVAGQIVGLTEDLNLVLSKVESSKPPYFLNQDIEYHLIGVNLGNTTLHNVNIIDLQDPIITCTPLLPASLAPKASVDCLVRHRITQEDLNRGYYTNLASITSDETQPAQTNATVYMEQLASINIYKTVVFPEPPRPFVAGDDVEYTISLRNNGLVNLSGVIVSDPWLERISCSKPTPASLVVGEAMSCTGYHTLTQLEIDEGSFLNIAAADSDQTDPFEDHETIYFDIDPNINVRKEVSIDQQVWLDSVYNVAPGQTVYYRIRVRNTSPTDITGVEVAESDAACQLTRGADLSGNNDAVLNGLEEWAYYCHTTAIEGTHRNLVTVTTDQSMPGYGEAFYVSKYLAADPSLTKTASPDSASIGDTVVFTLLAENMGSLPAESVIVIDRFPTTFTVTDVELVEAPFGSTYSVTPEIGTSNPPYKVEVKLGGPLLSVSRVMIKIAAVVNSLQTGNVQNQASITSITGDTNLSNNLSTWTTKLVPSGKTLPQTGFAPARQTLRLTDQRPAILALTEELTLEIPALGIKSKVLGVPVTAGGWDLTWLGSALGWLEGTAFPSTKGNSTITGHVFNSDGKPGIFNQLETLKFGDQILLHAFGQTYAYEVRENKLIHPQDFSALSDKNGFWLTLLTCKDFDEKTASYLSRVAVSAVLVEIR